MKHITLAEFLGLYEDGELFEVIVFKDKVYGRTYIDAANIDKGFVVVWADLPP